MKRRKRRKNRAEGIGVAGKRRQRAQGYLFLCGVARSGTTAAARLLNAHPKIAMGIERYKFLYGQQAQELNAELFERERFFEYRATDTNIRLTRGGFAGVYRELEEKYASAKYVGDKLPRLYQLYDRILLAFPASRFIYMVRDPLRTASSWQARADNAKDSWKPDNDFRKAIAEWNLGNRMTLQFLEEHPEQVLVVRYEDLFGDDAATLRTILDWLELRHAPDMLERYQTQIMPEAISIAQKTSLLTAEQQDEIGAAADWTTYRALVDRAKPAVVQDASTPRAAGRKQKRRVRRRRLEGATPDTVVS